MLFKTKKTLIGLGVATVATGTTLGVVLPIVLKKNDKPKPGETATYLAKTSAEFKTFKKAFETEGQTVAVEALKAIDADLDGVGVAFTLDENKVAHDATSKEVKMIFEAKKTSSTDVEATVAITFTIDDNGVPTITQIDYENKKDDTKNVVLTKKETSNELEDKSKTITLVSGQGLAKAITDGNGKIKTELAKVEDENALQAVTWEEIFAEVKKAASITDITTVKSSKFLTDLNSAISSNSNKIAFTKDDVKFEITIDATSAANDTAKTLTLKYTLATTTPGITSTRAGSETVTGFDKATTGGGTQQKKTVWIIKGDTSNNGKPTEYATQAAAKSALKALSKPAKVWKVDGLQTEYTSQADAWAAYVGGLTYNSASYSDNDVTPDDTKGVDLSSKSPATGGKTVYEFAGKAYNNKAAAEAAWLKKNPNKEDANTRVDTSADPHANDAQAVKDLVSGDADFVEEAAADTKIEDKDPAKTADVQAVKDLVSGDADFVEEVAADTKIEDKDPAKTADVQAVKDLVSGDADFVEEVAADTKIEDKDPAKTADVQAVKDLVSGDADFVEEVAADTKIEDKDPAKTADVQAVKDLVSSDTDLDGGGKFGTLNSKYGTKTAWEAAVSGANTLGKLKALAQELVDADTTKATTAPTWKANNVKVNGRKFATLNSKYGTKTAWEAAVSGANTLGKLKALAQELVDADTTKATKAPTWKANNVKVNGRKFATLNSKYGTKTAWEAVVSGANTLGKLKALAQELVDADTTKATTAPTWKANNVKVNGGKFATLNSKYGTKTAWEAVVSGANTLGKLKALAQELVDADTTKATTAPTWKANNVKVNGGKFGALNSDYKTKLEFESAVDGVADLAALKVIVQKLKDEDGNINIIWSPNNEAVPNQNSDINNSEIHAKNIVSSTPTFVDGAAYDAKWEPKGNTTYTWLNTDKTKSFTNKKAIADYLKTVPAHSGKVTEVDSQTKVEVTVNGTKTVHSTQIQAEGTLVESKSVPV